MNPEALTCNLWIFFVKIEKSWQEVIFLQKTSQKVCLDTLNAVLTSLLKVPPDVHNPSKKFQCSKKIVPFIANPVAAGIQFWRTCKIFSRNPDFFRQRYQNDESFTPTGQIVFSYIPSVVTKSYTLLVKITFAKCFSGHIEFKFSKPADKTIFKSANKLISWSRIIFQKNMLSKNISLVKVIFWTRIM